MQMNSLRRRFERPVAIGLLSAVALAGCTSTVGGQAVPKAAVSAESGAQLRFNDLGGGSQYIFVYPGASDQPSHKTPNGTYISGETEPITCHALGRLVVSHPEVGEELRQSTDWYKLVRGGSTDQYATAVYGDVVPEGATVPEC